MKLDWKKIQRFLKSHKVRKSQKQRLETEGLDFFSVSIGLTVFKGSFHSKIQRLKPFNIITMFLWDINAWFINFVYRKILNKPFANWCCAETINLDQFTLKYHVLCKTYAEKMRKNVWKKLSFYGNWKCYCHRKIDKHR